MKISERTLNEIFLTWRWFNIDFYGRSHEIWVLGPEYDMIKIITANFLKHGMVRVLQAKNFFLDEVKNIRGVLIKVRYGTMVCPK
jgi:hypothetical protein